MEIDNKALNNILSRAVKDKIPGVAASIISSSNTLYKNQFGYSNYSDKQYLHEDSLYRIASMTKAITSVCILQLMERGKLRIDSKLKDFFPEAGKAKILKGFDAHNIPLYKNVSADITIKHLLTHTSGFAYEIWNDKILKLMKLGLLSSAFEGSSNFLKAPLVHEPGASWEYGIGIDWLGHLVEKVSDLSLQDYMVKNVFKPLEMNDTSYDIPSHKIDRLSSVHKREDEGFTVLPFEIPKKEDFYSGGGNLISSLSDYSKFLQMILNNGSLNNRQILKKDSIQTMSVSHTSGISLHPMRSVVPFLSNDFDFFQGQKGSWALGFLLSEEDSVSGKPKNSLGSYGLFNSFCWIDKMNDLAGLLIMQMLPFFDEEVVKVLNSFEKNIYD
tara:strand:- start:12558 stop:13715 length:1158 start_codon:yes stop_codon:yes gene_type:complete